MATPKATPKYLIQKFPRKGIGRLFLRTDALASRADMFPYVGPVPASMQVKLDEETGIVTAVAADPHASALREEKVDEQAQTQAQTQTTETEVSPEPGKAVGASGANASDPDGGGKALKVNPDAAGDEEEDVVDLTPTYTPEQKHAKLVEEIGKMDAGNEEHFTKDGRPKIDHLMLALGGVDVSGPERDAAFADHLKKSKAKK